VGTFDPAVARQVADHNNGRSDKIKLTFHFVSLMRYSDRQAAIRAVGALNQNKHMIQDVLDLAVTDPSNDAFAALEDANIYTSYQQYETATNPDADHVLALWNPIQELPQDIINAVKDSDGFVSFPYDPNLINWMKSSANTSGLDMTHVSVTMINDHDGIYDSLRHGVGRIIHDVDAV